MEPAGRSVKEFVKEGDAAMEMADTDTIGMRAPAGGACTTGFEAYPDADPSLRSE